MLADVRDPGNAGSVIRAADAAGADAVILRRRLGGPLQRQGRARLGGGLFHLPVVTDVTSPSAITALRAAGLSILVADGSGRADLDTTDLLDQPTAWVFGNEAWGVPDDVAALADAARAHPDLRPRGEPQPGDRGRTLLSLRKRAERSA